MRSGWKQKQSSRRERGHRPQVFVREAGEFTKGDCHPNRRLGLTPRRAQQARDKTYMHRYRYRYINYIEI